MALQTRILERLRSEFERYAGDGTRGDLVLYECVENSPVRGIYLAVNLLVTARPSSSYVEGGEGDEIAGDQYVMRWIVGNQEEGEAKRIWEVFARLSQDTLRCLSPSIAAHTHSRYAWLKLVQEIGARTDHPVIRLEPELIHQQIDFSGPQPPRWRKHGGPSLPIPADYFESSEEATEAFLLLDSLDKLPVTVSGMFGGIFRASAYAIDAILEDPSLSDLMASVGRSNFPKSKAPDPKLVTASSDFSSVSWYGKRYTFASGHQRHSIRLLMEAFENGGHSLSQATIGESIGSSDGKFQLAKVFRKRRHDGGYDMHPAWGKMIQPDSVKGAFRLVPTESARNP